MNYFQQVKALRTTADQTLVYREKKSTLKLPKSVIGFYIDTIFEKTSLLKVMRSMINSNLCRKIIFFGSQ